jgi:hypothetical protein
MTAAKQWRKGEYHGRPTHGLYALQRALDGVQDFDKWLADQGEAGKPLRQLRAQMIEEQGGELVITAHERLLIDATLKTHLYLFLIDDYVLIEQASPVNRRNRKLFPVVLQRGPIYEALMKAAPILNDLRKNRLKKEPLSLPEYVRSKQHPMPDSPSTRSLSEAGNGLAEAEDHDP